MEQIVGIRRTQMRESSRQRRVGRVGRRDTMRVWRQSFSEGWLGGRFPRGLCYRLGRMTSSRYQILNLLAPGSLSSTRYPNLPSAVPRTATNRPALTVYYHVYHRRRAQRLPSKPTPSHYISISPLAAVLTLFVRIMPDIRG